MPVSPGLESTGQIDGSLESELAQRGRCQTRAVALVADHDDAYAGIGDLGYVMRAGGVESPLEHVAVNDQRSRQVPVTLSLFDRTGVDDQRARRHLLLQVGRLDPIEAAPGLVEEEIDARAPCHLPNVERA